MSLQEILRHKIAIRRTDSGKSAVRETSSVKLHWQCELGLVIPRRVKSLLDLSLNLPLMYMTLSAADGVTEDGKGLAIDNDKSHDTEVHI